MFITRRIANMEMARASITANSIWCGQLSPRKFEVHLHEVVFMGEFGIFKGTLSTLVSVGYHPELHVAILISRH